MKVARTWETFLSVRSTWCFRCSDCGECGGNYPSENIAEKYARIHVTKPHFYTPIPLEGTYNG